MSLGERGKSAYLPAITDGILDLQLLSSESSASVPRVHTSDLPLLIPEGVAQPQQGAFPFIPSSRNGFFPYLLENDYTSSFLM